MIVFGGRFFNQHPDFCYDAENVLWIGGRYDPQSDTWVAIFRAPAASYDHSAVWTGETMIACAGTYPIANLYDPTTDSWFEMSEEGAAPGTWGASVVWTGEEIIVWGGKGESANLSTGGRYDPGSTDFDNDGRPDLCDLCPETYDSADADGDGAGDSCDCNEADSAFFPGAMEVNDGIDNQCPGDPGFSLVDEISGNSGFLTPSDKDRYSWPSQSGATHYQAARASDPLFVGRLHGSRRIRHDLDRYDHAPVGKCPLLPGPRAIPACRQLGSSVGWNGT